MTIGYIYKIQPTIEHQPDEIYIGSTTKKLNERLYNHKYNYGRYLNGKYNNVSVFKLFDKFGLNNIEIVLLQEIDFNDKKQLTDLEGRFIKDNACVNKCIMGRTMKEYYNANKDKKIEYQKQYRKDNKNKLQQKHMCNVCGGKFTNEHKSQHFKSKKHQKALNNQPIININIKIQNANININQNNELQELEELEKELDAIINS